jgi:hypothetical protein
MWLVGTGAIAASVVVALMWPEPAPRPIAEPPIEVLAFSGERAKQEFAAFDKQLDQIDNELAELANRIALADAKRKAAELTDQYRP